MTEVISITLIVGSVIFGFGVASAREHRRQRESKAQAQNALREKIAPDNESLSVQKQPSGTARSMAAQGMRNGEEQFATVGNNSR